MAWFTQAAHQQQDTSTPGLDVITTAHTHTERERERERERETSSGSFQNSLCCTEISKSQSPGHKMRAYFLFCYNLT